MSEEYSERFDELRKNRVEVSYHKCGLPFEPEDETAGKILDFMIGEEQKE